MWLAVIPLGICGLKNNSRRITYGIGCVLGMPSLSPLSFLGRSPLSDFEAHTLQNDFVVFFRLGVKGESGQTLFSSLEALTFKIQGKTVSTILVDHDFCQIAWLAWFNSGIRIKYDRTCQWSMKITSIEKTFVLHTCKSAQKKHFSWNFFLKESSWWALLNHLKIENFEKWRFSCPGWYLN